MVTPEYQVDVNGEVSIDADCSQGLRLLAGANATRLSAQVMQDNGVEGHELKYKQAFSLWCQAAVVIAQEFGIYAIPFKNKKTVYWRPRMPSGYDPDLGWLLDTQPTLSGWKSWADAVNALAEYLDSQGLL